MSDDSDLRLGLRQLEQTAHGGIRPPGVEAVDRTVRRRARRRAAAVGLTVVTLLLGVAVLTNRRTGDLPPAIQPSQSPTASSPLPSVSPSQQQSVSPSASVSTPATGGAQGGGTASCPLPGETHIYEQGGYDVFYDPQWDSGLPTACQNRTTHVLLVSYRYAPDGSAVLFASSTYQLDVNHPKVTLHPNLPGGCETAAFYIVNGSVGPLARISDQNLSRGPYERAGVSHQLWGEVTARCVSPSASPSPTPS